MRKPAPKRSLAAALSAAALCLLAALPARAAFPYRSAHTATLLPTGSVLIAGGVDAAGAVLNSAELKLAGRDGSYVAVTAMHVHRASATATVMATGMVLVAGGVDDTGAVRADAEIYDPATNSWTCVGGGTCADPGAPGTGMSNPRYNHTATLLNNGKVLLCGGQPNTTGGINSTCDLFTPSALPTIGGSFSAAGPLQQARALHTATLLKDGKVLLAGGWNPNAAATNGWLPTTERYDPTTNGFSSANPLASARGVHTATMMGDGRVLIAGGYNGQNVKNNFGVLESMEIYDPVSNTVTPASPLNSRREMQSATLSSDGSVEFFGGLGNITTTYLTSYGVTWNTNPPSYFGASFSGVPGVSNITTPSGTMDPGELFLSVPVRGRLVNADVVSSSPTLTFGAGTMQWTSGDTNNPATGLQISLNGWPVGCHDNTKPPAVQNCGDVPVGGAPVINLNQGQVFFAPRQSFAVSGSLVPFGVINLQAPGTITSGSPTANIDKTKGNYLIANVNFTLDPSVANATIDSGTFVVTSGGYIQQSSFTVALTSGVITIPNGTPIDSTGKVTLNGIPITSLAGQVTWNGTDPSYSTSTPLMAPANGTLPGLSLTGTLVYTATAINVSGLTTSFGASTVVVREMIFGDAEYYNPQANAATFETASGDIPQYSSGTARFGHTATLLPDDDVLIVGGRDCQDPYACNTIGTKNTQLIPANVPSAPRFDDLATVYAKNFGSSSSLATARAFHSATLLTDGTILVAGGTNGPNILATAEIFDTKADAVSPTNGPMSVVRDLHTATLLPNGRVLLAGGFTTNATSTGSTNAADIYYPDTKLFLPTAVMISSRSNHTATLMPDGGVMVVGGYGAGDIISSTTEIYYSTSASWAALATMPAGGVCDSGSAGHPERALHTATLLKDGRLMVAGGINSQGVMKSVCAYTPATNSWAKLADLPHQLYRHTATLLFDGRVLVAGGDDGFGEFNASYIYDPSADAWTPTDPAFQSPLLQPRFGHTATLLPNDTVMISGGQNRYGVVATEIESFHVDASSWVAGGNLFKLGPRSFHTMTLAPNGYVYALGGSNGVVGGAGTSLYSQSEKGYFTPFPDLLSFGAPPSLRQSTITVTSPANPVVPAPGWTFTATGLQFRGGTEASGGGAASANSSFSFPHLLLQRIDGAGGSSSQGDAGFVLDLTTQIYLNNGNLATEDTSLNVSLPALTGPAVSAGLPRGWYNARVGANDVYSNGAWVQVGPAKPASAPASSSGTVMGLSSVTWTWSAVAGVDGYDVYQASSMVFLGTVPAISNPYFYQTNLPPNTTASLAIAGYTASGDGPLIVGATVFTLAIPPNQIQVASVSFNSVLVEWNPNGNTPGAVYEVSMSTDWPSPFSQSASTPIPSYLNTTTTTVLVPNLQPSTTYSFRVRTFNAVGVPSNFSVVVTTLTRTPVSNVVGLGVNPFTIEWQWTNPGGVLYYNVYDSTSGTFISTSATNIFFDAGLGTNTPRSIEVTAVTAAGEGPMTQGATVYTLANVPGLVTPFLTNLSTGGATVSWTSNGNPPGTSYRVVAFTIAPAGGGKFTQTYATMTTQGSIEALSGYTPSSLLDVSLMALNGDGLPSAWLEYSTYTLANPPVNLLVTQTTPISISLSWDTQGNSTMTYYEVTYSTDGFVANLSTAIAFPAMFNGSTTTVTGLITSTTYWLRVRAENNFGQTTIFSNTVTTITFNGGAPAGSLAGVLTANGLSQIQGILGNGRSVLVRSPGGAFPADVALTVSSYNATTPLCPNGLNVAFSLTESPAFQPSRPIYFTASYNPSELGSFAPAVISLMRFEPVSRTCVPLSTTFDAVAQTFTAELNHFSLYELAAVPLATDTSNARVYPNPYRAAHDGYVTIDQIPPGARVRVMTLRGETVLDQTANGAGLMTWSATNGASRPVGSGLYLVLIDWNGAHKVLKLAVIR